MAGYSSKPLGQKLGIKPGFAIAAIGAPRHYRDLLGTFPEGLRFCTVEAEPQLIHYFCTERARLVKELPALRKKMRDDAMLWVSWPKKNAGVPTTVTADLVRERALPLGLVDTKVCAVDETWSALRLVVRLANRKLTARPRSLA